MSVFVNIETITPEKAKEILTKNNLSNRPINNKNLEKIVKAMTNGSFSSNGDTITFAQDGRLLDGQHRLSACIKANYTLTVPVVYGVDFDTAFMTKDSGFKRTTQNRLEFYGIYGSYVKTAISLTILLIGYERKSVNIPDSLTITVDETDIINRMLSQPEILDSAKFAHSSSQSKKILTERLLGFTHYLFHQYFPQEAAEFFEKFERAENLSANSPILLVRNYLIDDKIQPNVLKLTKKRKLELVFACFKAFVFGYSLKIHKKTGEIFLKDPTNHPILFLTSRDNYASQN